MRHLGTLRELFGKLALATATASCTSGGIDNAEFSSNVCEGQTLSPLKGVTAGVPVDYMELREGNLVVNREGVPCDPGTPCGVKLASITSSVGWVKPSFVVTSGPRFLVFTRGDTVGVVTSISELVKFLAPIENPHDAALLVTEALPHIMLCRGNNARAVPGGWEIATQSGFACGKGTELDENIVFVSTNGEYSIRDVYVIERGSDNCSIGRRPEGLAPSAPCAAPDRLGAYFADATRLEAASVYAFERLARELRHFGAPKRLIREAHRARADELRHARVTRALAQKHGARPHAVRVRREGRRSLFAMLRENAVEGCVRETFGALVATYQGLKATDPCLASTMTRIAADETRHAALAWDIAAWAEPKLSPEEREELGALRARAAQELAHSLRDAHALSAAGLPGSEDSLRLLDALRPHLIEIIPSAAFGPTTRTTGFDRAPAARRARPARALARAR